MRDPHSIRHGIWTFTNPSSGAVSADPDTRKEIGILPIYRETQLASDEVAQDTLRIAVDARCLNRIHLRGMGKYVWNVLANVPDYEQVNWTLYGDHPEFEFHCPLGKDVTKFPFEMRGYRFRSWEQLGLPDKARKNRAHVLHATATTLPWWQPVPTVVTIHDTVPWTCNETDDPSWYLHRLQPPAYRKCAAIITISESSRRDILALWPHLEPKLHVIPHGVDKNYHEVTPAALSRPLREMGIREPYLLYIGGEASRKRLDWALRVFSVVDDDQLQLVACGIDQTSHNAVMTSLSPDLRRRTILPPFIAEEHMPRLMQNAVAVLYPTLYEGFGLPALEAQAVGTPVLFSRVGSLAELDGPGATVLPTEDLDAWVSACKQLIETRADNPMPQADARNWAGKYSWEESARRHLEIYRSAASNFLSSE